MIRPATSADAPAVLAIYEPEAGFVNAVARIALPNDASVKLFESHGFARMGTLEGIGYKLGRWVDVGEWQLLLTPRGDAPRSPSTP